MILPCKKRFEEGTIIRRGENDITNVSRTLPKKERCAAFTSSVLCKKHSLRRLISRRCDNALQAMKSHARGLPRPGHRAAIYIYLVLVLLTLAREASAIRRASVSESKFSEQLHQSASSTSPQTTAYGRPIAQLLTKELPIDHFSSVRTASSPLASVSPLPLITCAAYCTYCKTNCRDSIPEMSALCSN